MLAFSVVVGAEVVVTVVNSDESSELNVVVSESTSLLINVVLSSIPKVVASTPTSVVYSVAAEVVTSVVELSRSLKLKSDSVVVTTSLSLI